MLQSKTAVSGTDATLDFTSWYNSAYELYDITFQSIVPSTTGLTIQILCSTDGGSTWDTGANYSYGHFVWSNAGSAVGGGTGQTQFIFAPYAGRTLVTGTNFTFAGSIRAS